MSNDKQLLDALLDALYKKELRQSKAVKKAEKARKAAYNERDAFPPPPKLKWYELRRWFLRLKNWYLRYRGKKQGEVRPYWQRDFSIFELKRQERCNHLKGQIGYIVRGGAYKDFNVNKHTFIDGKSRIKCLTCGWEVWNLPEFIFKWQQGMRMVNQSTNTPSSSEILPKVEPNRAYNQMPPVGVAMARKTTYDPDVKGQPDNPIRGRVDQPKKESAG